MCRILNPHQYMGTLYMFFYLLFISAQFDESCMCASTSNSWNLLASHNHVLEFSSVQKRKEKKNNKKMDHEAQDHVVEFSRLCFADQV